MFITFQSLILTVVVLFSSTSQAANYEATPIVKAVADYDDNKWGDKDYFVLTGYLPGAILVLGILSLMIYAILLCFRCCCVCMKCAPDPTDPGNHYVSDSGHVKYYKPKMLEIIYYVTCIAGFAMAHLMWMASASFSSAFNEAGDSFNVLESKFTTMKTDCATSATNIDSSQALLATAQTQAASCYYEFADSSLTALESANNALKTMVDPIPGYLSDTQDLMDQGDTAQQSILYAAYVAILIVIGIYMFLNFFETKFGLKCVMPVTWFTVLILTIVCCIELYILMVACDFCLAPKENLLDELGTKSALYDVVNDYVSRDANGDACTNATGTDLYLKIIAINDSVTSMVNATDTALTLCNADNAVTDYSGMQSTRNSAATFYNVVDSMNEALDCNTIHNAWVGILEDALCSFFTEGMYYFWLSKHTTALFLFILMVVGSIIWQYYGDVEEDKQAFSEITTVTTPEPVQSGGINLGNFFGGGGKEQEMQKKGTTRTGQRGIFF